MLFGKNWENFKDVQVSTVAVPVWERAAARCTQTNMSERQKKPQKGVLNDLLSADLSSVSEGITCNSLHLKCCDVGTIFVDVLKLLSSSDTGMCPVKT